MGKIRATIVAVALVVTAYPVLATEENGPGAETQAQATAADVAESAPADEAATAAPAAPADKAAAAAPAAPADKAATAAPAEPASEAAATTSTGEPLSGRVARADFTTQVLDREPQDSIATLPNHATEILFFTELSGLTGHTLTHVWEREGTEMARVAFAVHGPRWRVYSTKSLEPDWLGEWTVSVVDEEGRVLRSERFEYVASAAEPAAESTAAASEELAPVPAAPAASD